MNKIQIPVIYPSTLTKEQREIIKKCFFSYEKRMYDETIEGFTASGHIDAFMWLFGEDFFKKGE